jgi:mono/diheme cytochrome c family protein
MRMQMSVAAACAALIVATLACNREAAQESRVNATAAARANEGIVAPLENDASGDIVSWVDGQVVTDWTTEVAKRDRAIERYLSDSDPARAEKYGFRSGQYPRLAWAWFRDNPVGFNGVPFVLLKTIFDLDPNNPNPTLRAIARIWKREATVPVPGTTGPAWTMDQIGIGPNPRDYVDGVARPASERQWPLPAGFAFENPREFAPLSPAETAVLDGRLLAKRVFQNTSLLIAKLKQTHTEDNWERDRPSFGSPGAMDRVFLSCAACHVGRVIVDGKMKFLAGMPNTEIEAQYYSKLLMLTSAALVESGFDPASRTAVNPANIQPNTGAIRALYTEMLDKARERPETLYGSSPAQIARGKTQALAVASEFPSVMQDLIAVGVKTHFIYYVVAKNNAYKAALPDVLEDRPGQMDAFGIASGLVAIHTRRPDNSFVEFVRRDNPKSPFFTGFSKANGLPVDVPGLTDAVTDPKAAGDRILKTIAAWAPPVPAPIDVKSVNWATERFHANWDGNQGASSRTLASGASATGDPRMVNVRIHEPLNPFIDNLPPPPYPFPVDLARAREGKAIFQDRCASCHKPRNQTIYKASQLGVDANRSMVNTSVSRYGLAALVVEVLHGIWAQAPYLHNGSVPTLAHLMCPQTRPTKFLRGNLNYDQSMVGFEWAERPTSRYGPHDIILVKEYDTAVPGKSNGGHVFGAPLCPDTSGLDPVRDRKEIDARIQTSPVGALLAYLRTL